jgi:winged helix DNA-binding protein
VRTIDVEERRARLGRRHLLAAPGPTPERAAEAVVGLHSSDPVTVFLSARARVSRFAASDLEESMYERRTLVRMLGMRRTLFVVPRHLAPAVDEACTKRYGAAERTRLVGMLEAQRVVPAGRGGRWVDRVMRETLAALAERGEATARQLTAAVPALANKLTFGEGKAWAGEMGVSTRILFLLAARGEIVRARPLGSWISGQYRWARTRDWLGEPLAALDHAEACAELVGRYLRAFGPVTTTDVRWWTGWTVQTTTRALREAGAVEVGLDDGQGWVSPGDVRRVRPPASWVAFLPGLDPTIMGWKERGWYLGEHGSQLFDRAGNAGPSVWVDGRVVGGWIQRRDGRVLVELLEPVSVSARRAIEAERRRVRDWLGDVRATPRFRTPLEMRLSAG